MAAFRPTRLDEYCKEKKLSFFSLEIPCVFCKFNLPLQGLADFHTKDLCLVWKKDKCYACCAPCLRLTAKYELENYFQCSVKGCMLESLLNVPLCELTVRCLLCYKKLSYEEKIYCCLQDLDFCLVRCHWKNFCRFCRVLQ
uniref:Protein E6 n=1 Tax=Human papillomavirus TaxID=10566 RepID=A0A385PK84_9PAPI|nr:MAG: E6 protein [Human papillomavirus]